MGAQAVLTHASSNTPSQRQRIFSLATQALVLVIGSVEADGTALSISSLLHKDRTLSQPSHAVLQHIHICKMERGEKTFFQCHVSM